MNRRRPRVDGSGRAYAGSQLQIQMYVDRHGEELSERIIDALGIKSCTSGLRWVSPLENEKFREYRDSAFLNAVDLRDHARELRKFWPRGGPSWDALAITDPFDADKRGVVLVEAKSYPGEIYGNGCQASRPSLTKIEAALKETKRCWV